MTAPAQALAAAYGGITAVVSPLSDNDLLRATRCRGWVVADLLFHVLCDAQRALVTLATPADGPSDVDFVSYWSAYPGSGDHEMADASAWWVRRSTSAFRRPGGVVTIWSDTAPAAARAAAAADPAAYVGTQGLVLRVSDFLSTLVTEAVIHHLDMTLELPDAPSPAPEAVEIAVSTMDGLMSDDAVRPASWSAIDYLLKASGRLPLNARDRMELGEAAGWFPLLT
jgi:Mycothiol maleylpyruvate isomerase N-terminal domain